MRASAFFATVLAFFTLFACTAAQSPIVTTSTSNELSDDMQDDDLTDISIPENDDLVTTFDDSAQFTDGSETDASGVQSASTTDDYGSPVSPTPAGSSSTAEEAAPTAPDSAAAPTPATTTTPSPVSSPTASAVNPTPTPITASSDEPTAAAATATLAPSASATEGDESESTVVVETPTPAAADLPTESTTDSETTPAPSVASTTNSTDAGAEETKVASGAPGLWSHSWSTASTAAVGALGVLALRFGVFSGEL